MRKVKTIGVVKLHTGILELSAEQAAKRKHLLAEILDDNGDPTGRYSINDTVTFKAGESFSYDGEIKPFSNSMVDAESGVLISALMQQEKAAVRAMEQAEAEDAAPDQGESEGDDVLEAEDDAPEEEEGDDLIAQLIEMIPMLDPATDYRAGKPKVNTLKELLGRDDVTQVSIDLAIEQMNGD